MLLDTIHVVVIIIGLSTGNPRHVYCIEPDTGKYVSASTEHIVRSAALFLACNPTKRRYNAK